MKGPKLLTNTRSLRHHHHPPPPTPVSVLRRFFVSDAHYSLRERLFSDFGSLALDFVESGPRLGRHSVLLDLCNMAFPPLDLASALDC